MPKKTLLDYLTAVLWLLIVGSFSYALWTQDWSNVFVVFMAAALSSVPYVLYKKYQVTIAKRLRFGIIAFLFSTLVLGEVNSFYTQFRWWDIALHFVAGLGLTVIGFAILTSIYPRHDLKVKPYFTSIFAFSFTAMIASLWEVFEFGADALAVTQNAMQNGNTDTMSDIIVSLLAAVIVCVLGFRYITTKEKNVVGDMIVKTKL
jgi:hypothetical protein